MINWIEIKKNVNPPKGREILIFAPDYSKSAFIGIINESGTFVDCEMREFNNCTQKVTHFSELNSPI